MALLSTVMGVPGRATLLGARAGGGFRASPGEVGVRDGETAVEKWAARERYLPGLEAENGSDRQEFVEL